MENTNTYFEREIKDLCYSTVEEEIAYYFDMGSPDNSSFPQEILENSSGKYVLICTNKSGTFDVSNYKLKNGNYLLSVRLVGKLHRA